MATSGHNWVEALLPNALVL